MKVLIACDKFKGSLSAYDVCHSIAKGIKLSDSSIDCHILPLADGGDGTLAVLEKTLGLEKIKVKTIDPLSRQIESTFLSDGQTAFIELADASGMQRLESTELDVMSTTTVGTGLVIKEAVATHNEIVLCLGGSCTNDVGLGILYALGFSFYNSNGERLIPNGGNLLDIKTIKSSTSKNSFSIKILCDVTNPLYGEEGAAYVYGKQKGGSSQEIETMDQGMRNVAKLILEKTGRDISNIKGAGAAGGIAAGLYGLLDDIQMKNGFKYVSDKLNLESQIALADIVISGEGQLDASSLKGKVVNQVALLSQQYQKAFYAVVGSKQLSNDALDRAHIKACYSVFERASSLDDSMKHCAKYLSSIGEDLVHKFRNNTW